MYQIQVIGLAGDKAAYRCGARDLPGHIHLRLTKASKPRQREIRIVVELAWAWGDGCVEPDILLRGQMEITATQVPERIRRRPELQRNVFAGIDSGAKRRLVCSREAETQGVAAAGGEGARTEAENRGIGRIDVGSRQSSVRRGN